MLARLFIYKFKLTQTAAVAQHNWARQGRVVERPGVFLGPGPHRPFQKAGELLAVGRVRLARVHTSRRCSPRWGRSHRPDCRSGARGSLAVALDAAKAAAVVEATVGVTNLPDLLRIAADESLLVTANANSM